MLSTQRPAYLLVSIQLVSPASGDKRSQLNEVLRKCKFPFN